MEYKKIIPWLLLAIYIVFSTSYRIKGQAEIKELNRQTAELAEYFDSTLYSEAFLASLVLHKINDDNMAGAKRLLIRPMTRFYSKYGPVDTARPNLRESELSLLSLIKDEAEKEPLLKSSLMKIPTIGPTGTPKGGPLP